MSCAHDTSLTIRASTDVLDRAGRLQAELRQLPEYRATGLTRAGLIRLALVAGLEALERRRREVRP